MDLSIASVRFLECCAVEKKLSRHTLDAYRGDLKQFARQLIHERKIVDFSEVWIETAVQSWLSDPDLKATTVKRRLACLKVFVRWLYQRKFIPSDFLGKLHFNIRLPKRLPRNLQVAEMKKLVAVSPETLVSNIGSSTKTPGARRGWDRLTARLAIEILALTGVRVGELVKIRSDDIDHTARQINIFGKGNRERRVIFPDRITSIRIRAYQKIACTRFGKDVPGLLLLNGLGNPASDQYVRRIIRLYAQEVDIGRRVTPHMLRHTAATQLLEAGVDMRFVQRLLGHASITTTEIYTHVSDYALRDSISRVNIRKRLEIDR